MLYMSRQKGFKLVLLCLIIVARKGRQSKRGRKVKEKWEIFSFGVFGYMKGNKRKKKLIFCLIFCLVCKKKRTEKLCILHLWPSGKLYSKTFLTYKGHISNFENIKVKIYHESLSLLPSFRPIWAISKRLGPRVHGNYTTPNQPFFSHPIKPKKLINSWSPISSHPRFV